ncbi:MAG: hypothetical protein WA843_01740 [Candidatus Saccharimonadales bacterium]
MINPEPLISRFRPDLVGEMPPITETLPTDLCEKLHLGYTRMFHLAQYCVGVKTSLTPDHATLKIDWNKKKGRLPLGVAITPNNEAGQQTLTIATKKVEYTDYGHRIEDVVTVLHRNASFLTALATEQQCHKDLRGTECTLPTSIQIEQPQHQVLANMLLDLEGRLDMPRESSAPSGPAARIAGVLGHFVKSAATMRKH